MARRARFLLQVRDCVIHGDRRLIRVLSLLVYFYLFQVKKEPLLPSRSSV